MRFLYFFGAVFLLLCSSAQTRAQTVVPDTISPVQTLNESFFWQMNCAHGHECCQAHCPCCPELSRAQRYDTFVSPEVRGIKRYTIIERYSIANANAIEPVQFVFKNAAGEITASYFGKWKYVYERNDSPEWKIKLRNDPVKGFKNGVAIVHDENFDYSLVDETGKTLPIAFQSSVPFGNKGLRKVSLIINDERIFGIADAQGNKRSPLKFYSIGPLQEGMARVSVSGYSQVGFIDENGNEVVPCNYNRSESFSDGVCVLSGDSGSVLTDRSGKPLFKTYYHSLGPLKEGLVAAGKNQKYGFINISGEVIIPLKYDLAYSFSDGRAVVMRNNKWGYIDRDGNEVVPLLYDNATNFSDGRAAVCVGDYKTGRRWGVIDINGENIISPVYDDMSPFCGGYARVVVSGKGCGIINRNGTEVIPCKYNIENTYPKNTWFPAGRILASDKNRRFFLLDKKGREVLALDEYAHVQPLPRSGYAQSIQGYLLAQKREGKSGVIDAAGKVIIPFNYTRMQLESDSILLVFDGNNMGYLSLTGEVLLAPQPDRPVTHFEDGIVKLLNEKSNTVYFMDRNGKTIVEPY